MENTIAQLHDENAELRESISALNDKMDKIMTMLKANHRQELRRVKKNRPADAPKPAISAYLHYSSAMRESIKSANPDATLGEISKKIGAKWREIKEADKKKYTDIAAEDKARFQAETAEYEEKASNM